MQLKFAIFVDSPFPLLVQYFYYLCLFIYFDDFKRVVYVLDAFSLGVGVLFQSHIIAGFFFSRCHVHYCGMLSKHFTG
jgi:hypothetical protein